MREISNLRTENVAKVTSLLQSNAISQRRTLQSSRAPIPKKSICCACVNTIKFLFTLQLKLWKGKRKIKCINLAIELNVIV